MSEYKSVRLELKVYDELMRLMRPRESISQTIERLLAEMDEMARHARAIMQAFEEDKQWTSKQ